MANGHIYILMALAGSMFAAPVSTSSAGVWADFGPPTPLDPAETMPVNSEPFPIVMEAPAAAPPASGPLKADFGPPTAPVESASVPAAAATPPASVAAIPAAVQTAAAAAAPTVMPPHQSAANTDAPEATAGSEPAPRFYGSVGAQLLSSKLSGDGTIYESRLTLESMAFRAGWRATPFFGVEVEGDVGVAGQSFAPFGRVDFQNRYQVDLVSYVPISRRFELLLRAGYGHLALKATDYTYQYGGYPNFNQIIRLSNSYILSAYTYNFGVGAQYFLTRYDGVRLDYTGEKADKAGATEISNYSLSYIRKF